MSRRGARARDQTSGKALIKGLDIEGHTFHLGLLQHDFRNEDVIGVSCGPPGHLPPLFMKKAVEVPAKPVDGGGGQAAHLKDFGKWLRA